MSNLVMSAYRLMYPLLPPHDSVPSPGQAKVQRFRLSAVYVVGCMMVLPHQHSFWYCVPAREYPAARQRV